MTSTANATTEPDHPGAQSLERYSYEVAVPQGADHAQLERMQVEALWLWHAAAHRDGLRAAGIPEVQLMSAVLPTWVRLGDGREVRLPQQVLVVAGRVRPAA
jgi:hypothetical protein